MTSSNRTQFPTTFHAKGEEHGRHKLTWEQVDEIRRVYQTRKISQRELARLFNVSQTTIYRVIRNVNWQNR